MQLNMLEKGDVEGVMLSFLMPRATVCFLFSYLLLPR
jgi:hypothetical protein